MRSKPRYWWTRGPRHTQYTERNEAIDRDPAIQLYYEGIKGRRRNNGFLSLCTQQNTRQGARGFLDYLGVRVTDHSFTDMIKQKKDNPTDLALDNSLLAYSNLNPIKAHRQSATYVKGIFTRNGVKLTPKIDSHFSKRTLKISDGILKEIFEAQDAEKQTLMELQAYSGERVKCIAKLVQLSQIRAYDDKYSIITIEHWQTKARIPHICIIPRGVADAVIGIAEQTHRQTAFPNYETLWREITRYALAKHGVRLTSHYLRKRFHTIAQKTAMPVNHWDYLMGDSMKEGHEAEIYTLDDDTEIIQEYGRFLAPRLSLSNPQEDFLTGPSSTNGDLPILTKTIEVLTHQISELLAQNAELTRQLALVKEHVG